MGCNEMKRRLGNGRWDRVLMANMVELSVADNYDEASEEWIATGKCWWSTSGEQMPSWVSKHPNKCLCGFTTKKEISMTTKKIDSVRRCTRGYECNYTAKEKLKHFVSKDAFNIEGLGKKVIDQFCDLNLIHYPYDKVMGTHSGWTLCHYDIWHT